MQLNDEVLERVADRFRVMSEPLRLKILQILKEEELSVGELAEKTGLKHGTASANLNALLKAGLVSCRREGTKSFYRVTSPMVFQLCDLVCQSIKTELEDLARLRKSLK